MNPGDVLTGLKGTYRIENRHAEGAFGITYRATDVSSGDLLIVKELRLDKLDDWKALELFEREGRVLADVSHPNVPAFHDFFAHGAEKPLPVAAMTSYDGSARLSLVLVQEFIEGQTLQQRVDAGRPLDAQEAKSVLSALLGALDYLHSHSPPLVHRDIKPGNIILRSDGRPYLVDFGAIQDRLRQAGSGGSTIVGTLGYMPFEQIRGEARPASDLYALGVTLVVGLTGRSIDEIPFDESTGKIAVSRAVPRDTPRALVELLEAMTAPLLGQRPHSASEVFARLAAESASAPHSASHDGGAPEPDGALSAPRRHRRSLNARVLITCSVLAAACALFGIVRQGKVGPTPVPVAYSAAPEGGAAKDATATSATATDSPVASSRRSDDALSPPLQDTAMKKAQDDCRASKGDRCHVLGDWYMNAKPQDLARALDAYRRGCQRTYAQSCTQEAWFYIEGKSVLKDEAQGRSLDKLGCEGGDALGCANYCYGLAYGRGVPVDLPGALAYCQRSCRANSSAGCNNLGKLYRDGLGVKADPERAAGLFAQACDGDYKSACVALGELYAQGRGVARDRARAVSFYQTACKAKVQDGCDALSKLNVGQPAPSH
jgi:hypothetical protein